MNHIDYYKDELLYYHHDLNLPPFSNHFGMHAHSIYEFLYIISGEGVISIEGIEYALTPHSLYILRPNELHFIKLKQTEKYERKVLHFYPQILESIDPLGSLTTPFLERNLGQENHYQLSDEEEHTVSYNFNRIKEEMNGYGKRLATTICLLELLSILNERKKKGAVRENTAPTDLLLSEIIEYINRNLEKQLTIEHLCITFFLTPYQLNHKFQSAMSLSAKAYIKKKRMIHGNTLILQGIPAQEVALRCGYQDYSSFFRAYKKMFGKAPTK